MRHSLLLCGIACLILSGVAHRASAQPDTLWTRAYDLGSNSSLYATIELQTGGFAAAGFVWQGASDNALLIRLDPLGDTLWTRSWGTAGNDENAYDVAELSDGTIAVCGNSMNSQACFVAGYSQNGVPLWSQEFDPVGSAGGTSLLPTEDGGFWYLARKLVNGREHEFWLIRCDENGDSLYSRSFGTLGSDIPSIVLRGSNETLEIVGSRRNVGSQDYDIYHVTADAQGDFIREQVFGEQLWEQVHGAAVDTTTGDLIFVGEIRDSGNRDGYAMRVNPDGTVLWANNYEAERLSERIAGVAPYLEGGVLFAGQTGTSINSGRLWLLSVGINGDTLWTWTGEEAGRSFEDLKRIADGGFIACGKANIGNRERSLMWRISPPSGISGEVRDRETGEVVPGTRIQVAELPQYSVSDSIGRFTLALPAGTYTMYSGGPCFSGDTLRDIDVIANENTFTDITVGVAHMTMSHSSINVLAKNREIGTADFEFKNEGSGDLVFSFEAIPLFPAENWLRVDPPSGRVTPGQTFVAQVIVEADTTDDGTYDYFGEIRLHTNSCPDTLRIVEVLVVVLDAESGPELPSEFALYPAYPNPFNSTTTLRFGLDRDSEISLSLFDITGRQVVTLVDHQRLPAGEHRVSFEANGLASGLYFARLQDQARSLTQRLLYIR